MRGGGLPARSERPGRRPPRTQVSFCCLQQFLTLTWSSSCVPSERPVTPGLRRWRCAWKPARGLPRERSAVLPLAAASQGAAVGTTAVREPRAPEDPLFL